MVEHSTDAGFMKSVIILFSVLLMTWPSKANACDSGCDVFNMAILGGYVLTSTIVIPLIGLASYKAYGVENLPYWKAVGFTAVASAAGLGLGYLRSDEIFRDEIFFYFTVPGAVATYLTFRYAPRPSEITSNSLWQYAPQVSVSPVARGGSIRLNWSF